MDGHRAKRPSQHVKLKESCDICSASKIRCTKEKPSCTRCTKFGHVCRYSPARRIGRPHCSYSHSPITAISPTGKQAANLGASTFSTDIADSMAGGSLGDKVPTTPVPDLSPPILSHSSASNCDSLILDILQNLSSHQAAESLDTASFSLTTSIKSLSRILICPCSQRLDIALLACAVCNAILDVAGALTNVSYGASCTPSSGGITPIIMELHQVANLVVQFTRRYELGDELDEELREYLPGLAAELRARLQSTIEEATDPPILDGGVLEGC